MVELCQKEYIQDFQRKSKRLYIIMRRNQLKESLLSSSQYNRQEPQPKRKAHQQFEDMDLGRLSRKFNNSLPELKKQLWHKASSPFLCPILFSPQSGFIISWQILNIILIYLYFLQIPIILAFENHRWVQTNQRFFQVINTITIFIFLCGILIKMNTSFYQDGLLRKDPKEIRMNYFKTFLILDLISILSILIYQVLQITDSFDDISLKIFVALFYLKFIELLNTQKIMINSFDLNRRTKATFKLFLLVMKILLICNAVACSAYFISNYLADNRTVYNPDGTICRNDCYWVLNVTYANKSLKDYDQDFIVQYIYSLYWASTTMISIGYGDITPKNPTEVGFTVFIQFLSCLLYGFSINSIWSIVQELNAKKSRIRSRLNTINLYMRDKDINNELTQRVNAYLNNYYYAKNLREKDLEAEIIGELTPALKKQLFYQSYSVIFNHKYFHSTNLQLKQNLCCLVKQIGFYEEQKMFTNENSRQPGLYYIKKGELRYETGKKTHVLIKNLYTKDTFGMYEFFTQLYFGCQITATQYSQTFYIKISDWRTALFDFNQDFQKYYETKQELLIYRNGGVIAYKCQLCNSKEHRTQNCLDDQLRDIIKNNLKSIKIMKNHRDFYHRREFKTQMREKYDKNDKRHRKPSIKINQRKVVSKIEHHNTISLPLIKTTHQQIIRKTSFDEYGDTKKGKTHIKNQHNKNQHLKALQKIRKQFNHGGIVRQQQSISEILFQTGFQLINIDVVQDYTDYYPSFNRKEPTRDFVRRRMTYRFI